MRFFFILFFIPTLSFGQSIKLACQETSLIDYSKVHERRIGETCADDTFLHFEF